MDAQQILAADVVLEWLASEAAAAADDAEAAALLQLRLTAIRTGLAQVACAVLRGDDAAPALRAMGRTERALDLALPASGIAAGLRL